MHHLIGSPSSPSMRMWSRFIHLDLYREGPTEWTPSALGPKHNGRTYSKTHPLSRDPCAPNAFSLISWTNSNLLMSCQETRVRLRFRWGHQSARRLGWHPSLFRAQRRLSSWTQDSYPHYIVVRWGGSNTDLHFPEDGDTSIKVTRYHIMPTKREPFPLVWGTWLPP